mgnify:CR=1 FL=1
MHILKAEHIEKTIQGKRILCDIDLELKSGLVYGIVGRNGSGKTMLFRAMSGLMKLTRGRVEYDGQELKKDFDVLPSLGITIEHAGMYPEFTGLQNLKILARIKGNISEAEICDAIERVGLDPADKRIVKKYSLGMKQRLAIAQAVMEKPEVIMLDEPTNGLDEDGVSMIRQIISEERERGSIVLLASHNKEDINMLADKVYRISEGRLQEE